MNLLRSESWGKTTPDLGGHKKTRPAKLQQVRRIHFSRISFAPAS